MRKGQREEVRGRGKKQTRVAALNNLGTKIPNINKLYLSRFHTKL